MRLMLAAATTLALMLPASAESLDIPSGTYKNDPTHSSIVWKVSHIGFSTYTGMFAREAIDATIELDADDVANSKLSVTLAGREVRTLHPGDTDFNAEIASAMFMNTAEFPEVTFTATEIDVTGENTADITGELTIAGQTHPLTLKTTLNQAANHPMAGTPALGITATGSLMRSQYGNEGLLGPISDEVTIEIQAEFMKQD
ncbi:YceI family protein [Acuticoccus sp. I52.16.1]|uniref:YceI family protein n=1 Tax=Acuticoccus sp. I52.16.1 TaxID=2928472 RepID=UPI001FD371B7|nr:YceI family protein [Acuticoccus sp. I52.16.1]UOM35970.1 YceI family protein [Acuticoccus sp. I52.16.1]